MKVIVKEPGSVEWEGKSYLPGETIDLPKDEAERLIKKGKARESKGEDTGKAEPEPDAEIMEAAKDAINAGKVTQDGKPEVKAIEEILGRDITAQKRDEIWEELTKDEN